MKGTIIFTVLALASMQMITCQNLEGVTQTYAFNIVLMPEVMTTEAVTTSTSTTTTAATTTTSTTTQSTSTTVTTSTGSTIQSSTTTPAPSTTTTTAPSTMTTAPSTMTTTAPSTTATEYETTTETTNTDEGTTLNPLFDDSNNDTQVTTPEIQTTQTPEYIALIAELQTWLQSQFYWTTGYMSLVVKPTVSPVPVQQSSSQAYEYTYDVKYNVSVLSLEGALGSTLINQFNMVKYNITTSNEQFPGNYTVDQEATNTVMTQDIETASNTIQASCDNLGAICNNINTTCYLTDSEITCADKCMLYSLAYVQCEAPPNPAGVYWKGQCNLIDGNAYCNCGKSAGGVLDNFWDGQKCVSITFIVCICACLGGGLIVIFMSIVIWLATERRRQKDIQDIDTLPINGYGKSDYPTQAYDNAAYDIDPEIRNSQAYQGFAPNLQSVDTSTSYQIKRPSVRRGESPPRDYAHDKGNFESAYL